MPYFEPSCPNPAPPLTSEERVAQLRRCLDPHDELYTPTQKKNLDTLIRMYERGETVPGNEVRLIDGEVVTAKEMEWPKTFFWHEVLQISLVIHRSLLIVRSQLFSYSINEHRNTRMVMDRIRIRMR